ncbi:energy transducer TonB [Sphingomonas sp.]|uniref:energy transducer TonB n=1 Tax=Sphingomonas sp. TaxID=28214 RepID=UPI002586F394|nr:energy transducer TonB [Sphingomonas sp.]
MMSYFIAAAVTLLSQAAFAQGAMLPAVPLIPLDQWFHTDDYPPASMRGGEEGNVSVILSIDSEGKIEGCRVTNSSGHPLLDRATCTLAIRRGRFTPAKDAQRRPVASDYVVRDVKWRIAGIGAPSGGPPILEIGPSTTPVPLSGDPRG